MTKNHSTSWDITKGDYAGNTSKYDKLYKQGRKRDSLTRKFYWAAAALVTLVIFRQILAYFAWS
ncbi:MAG: hypothetical protein HBSAPP04_04470 [Ignavibacteriaceae bacterium]|nr:MAG: hypothetical protein HBSAPP04_04470 [Ignavibacteriaceae bacterium]